MMKNNIYNKIQIVVAIILLFSSLCQAQDGNTRATRYNGFYKEQPSSLLILPPINKTSQPDADAYFYTTINTPLAERGYYVIPPYMAYSLFKNDSLFKTELYLNNNLSEFKNVFDADAVVITIIHNWEKKLNNINVDIEYIIKSTKTNSVLFQRRCELDFSTEKDLTPVTRFYNLVVSALNTVVKGSVVAARKANIYVFNDLPFGSLHPDFQKDSKIKVGDAVIHVTVD